MFHLFYFLTFSPSHFLTFSPFYFFTFLPFYFYKNASWITAYAIITPPIILQVAAIIRCFLRLRRLPSVKNIGTTNQIKRPMIIFSIMVFKAMINMGLYAKSTFNSC